MAGLPDYFENMNHAELAKVRGKDQRLSTMDKKRLLKKLLKLKVLLHNWEKKYL